MASDPLPETNVINDRYVYELVKNIYFMSRERPATHH